MKDGYFDRTSFPGAGGPNNFILIRHDDGSTALYLHHAKWSSMVQVRQRVFEREPIALVGSAGNSSVPHVHLEIADSDGTVNEPFAGTCRAGVSLWQSAQPPHILGGAIAHYTSGIAPAVPGIDTIKERFPDLTRVQQTAPTAAARSESDIRSGAACGFCSSPLPSTLRGNWRMNGNANDSTANGLHGVRSGGAVGDDQPASDARSRERNQHVCLERRAKVGCL